MNQDLLRGLMVVPVMILDYFCEGSQGSPIFRYVERFWAKIKRLCGTCSYNESGEFTRLFSDQGGRRLFSWRRREVKSSALALGLSLGESGGGRLRHLYQLRC